MWFYCTGSLYHPVIVFKGLFLYLLYLERNVGKKEIFCCEESNEGCVLSGNNLYQVPWWRNFTKFNDKWIVSGIYWEKLIWELAELPFEHKMLEKSYKSYKSALLDLWETVLNQGYIY